MRAIRMDNVLIVVDHLERLDGQAAG